MARLLCALAGVALLALTGCCSQRPAQSPVPPPPGGPAPTAPASPNGSPSSSAPERPAGEEAPAPAPVPGGEADACVSACIQRNAMRAVGAEQIESDCRIECRGGDGE